MKFAGQAFGPGFPDSGAKIEFEVNDVGLRLYTTQVNIADDGTPLWNAIAMHASGWDGRQLRLEWTRDSRTYSLSVSDPAAADALRRLATGKSVVARSGPDRGTHAVAWLLVFLTVVLPLLLLGALVWQHDRIATWAVERIPLEQEMKLGELFFSQHKASLKLIDGPPLALVRDLGARLTRGSPYRYQFHVADDNSVNAFAMPGGYVVVHTGLILLADTPEELAGVLAHEVQHVEQRHSLRAMAQSLGLYAVLSLLLGDTSSLASLGGDLLKLKFSRDHETEADREGLKALVAAGIRPQGMRDFFAKMVAQSKLELGLLSTHPASEERMAEMDRMIRALPEEARNAAPLAHDYAAIKTGLAKR